jgi:hypothetical protein
MTVTNNEIRLAIGMVAFLKNCAAPVNRDVSEISAVLFRPNKPNCAASEGLPVMPC